jgi:serine/threonine protein phosphatase PrpC
MILSHCATTHPGVRRQTNEDGYCSRPDLGLFAVADGVGGQAAGEVAARVALQALEQAVVDTAESGAAGSWPFEFQPALGIDGNRLNWAVHLANRRVRSEMQSSRSRQGMATTIAAVLLNDDNPGSATIAHVGDSRIYRWREGGLGRLTRDHSWVQEQVDAGMISASMARTHPRRNLLTRALSGTTDPVTDIGFVPIAPHDKLLLCTDGLCTALRDEEIADIVSGKYGTNDGTTTCDALVQAANLAGGPDNVTVVLISLA